MVQASLRRCPVASNFSRLGYRERTGAHDAFEMRNHTQVDRCNGVVAPVATDWKTHVVIRRSPVGMLGPVHTSSDQYFLIEAFCPLCGTLLDVEVGTEDSPLQHDVIVRWPEPISDEKRGTRV